MTLRIFDSRMLTTARSPLFAAFSTAERMIGCVKLEYSNFAVWKGSVTVAEDDGLVDPSTAGHLHEVAGFFDGADERVGEEGVVDQLVPQKLQGGRENGLGCHVEALRWECGLLR
jgi:hypothetical protein